MNNLKENMGTRLGSNSGPLDLQSYLLRVWLGGPYTVYLLTYLVSAMFVAMTIFLIPAGGLSNQSWHQGMKGDNSESTCRSNSNLPCFCYICGYDNFSYSSWRPLKYFSLIQGWHQGMKGDNPESTCRSNSKERAS